MFLRSKKRNCVLIWAWERVQLRLGWTSPVSSTTAKRIIAGSSRWSPFHEPALEGGKRFTACFCRHLLSTEKHLAVQTKTRLSSFTPGFQVYCQAQPFSPSHLVLPSSYYRTWHLLLMQGKWVWSKPHCTVITAEADNAFLVSFRSSV